MINYKPVNKRSIDTANNSNMSAIGVGSVNLKVISGGKVKKILLTEVLYIPTAASNLVSVEKKTRSGCQVNLNDDRCTVY